MYSWLRLAVAKLRFGSCQIRFGSYQTQVWQLPNSDLAAAKLWFDSFQTQVIVDA